jgi:SEC-C motif domain protein
MSRTCPCQSRKTFDLCCEPYLKGRRQPGTAAELMRSRFTAYAEGRVDYLIASTALAQREALDRADLLQYCRSIRCLNLKILSTELGGEGDETGTVLFHASLQVNGRRVLHRELSRFVREDGRWMYVEGETND